MGRADPDRAGAGMTNMDKGGGRRAGGRSARRALRQDAAAKPHPSPPGQIGGRYRPLSDAEIGRIHKTALKILDEVGMGEVPPIVVERALQRGCRLDEAGRLRFPPAFVEDVIAGAAKRVVLHGRKSEHDLEIGGRSVHYGTGGAAVQTLDLETAQYRPSTLRDVYDFARLVDRLENITWFTRCCVATDMADPFDLDVNTAYAIAAGTHKHVGTSFAVGEHVGPVIAMFDMMLGGEGRFRQRP